MGSLALRGREQRRRHRSRDRGGLTADRPQHGARDLAPILGLRGCVAKDAAAQRCYNYEMPQLDQDAIRRFVRDWKREVAFDEQIRWQKHKKEKAENDTTRLIAFSIVSLAVTALLCLLFLRH
jgi:hypothetical protein